VNLGWWDKIKPKHLIYVSGIGLVLVMLVLFYQIPINSEYINLDRNRQIGTGDTSLGSPIMMSSNAFVTIIEFGDSMSKL